MSGRTFFVTALAICGSLALPTVALHAETVASPDGRIVVTLDADGDGVPFYVVTRAG